MKTESLSGLRDAAHDLDSTEQQWLDGLAIAYSKILPGVAQVVTVDLRITDDKASLEGIGAHGPTPRALIWAATRLMPAEANRRIMRQTSTVGSLSEWVGPERLRRYLPLFASVGIGLQDFVALRSVDGGDRLLGVSAWYKERQRTSQAFKARLEPLAAHLATMFRLRRTLGGQALQIEHGGAVLEVDGRIAHANEETSSPSLRQNLQATVQRAERARTKAGTRDGVLWDPLVDGRWTLVDRFDTDGRRYYVAVENDPRFTGIHALSKRERQVSRMAAQGLANKEIAYALGLNGSSIATYMRRSLEKLRLRDRSELPYILEESARSLTVGSQALMMSATEPRLDLSLTNAEQEVASLAALGGSDRSIAKARHSSARTVANLLRSVYKKLRVANRTELVRVLRQPNTKQVKTEQMKTEQVKAETMIDDGGIEEGAASKKGPRR